MTKQITTSEAAKIIGCSRRHAGHLCINGELLAQRIGRDWLVDRASAEAYRDREVARGRPRTRPQKKKKVVNGD